MRVCAVQTDRHVGTHTLADTQPWAWRPLNFTVQHNLVVRGEGTVPAHPQGEGVNTGPPKGLSGTDSV